MKAISFLLPFLRKEEITKDIYSFFFNRLNIPDFDFIPGQYIRMILPHTNLDDRGTSRFFTIASSSCKKDILVITTKKGESSFKKRLFSLSENEKVEFFGPLGRFVLDEEDRRARIYLAGGMGITPYYPMVLYAVEKKLTIPMTLFVSYTLSSNRIYTKEFENIMKNNSWFRLVETITNGKGGNETWTGEKGRITSDMIKKYCPDFQKRLFMISGPDEMVDTTESLVKSMQVSEEQIQTEKFTRY